MSHLKDDIVHRVVLTILILWGVGFWASCSAPHLRRCSIPTVSCVGRGRGVGGRVGVRDYGPT